MALRAYVIGLIRVYMYDKKPFFWNTASNKDGVKNRSLNRPLAISILETKHAGCTLFVEFRPKFLALHSNVDLKLLSPYYLQSDSEDIFLVH